MGKPSVFFRKTIKTTAGDGSAIAVNAQQYAVLVMDVPDLRARCAWRSLRKRCMFAPHVSAGAM